MSSKQHVGVQSDALVAEDAELREAIGRRAKIKPTGTRFTGVSRNGNGAPCPDPACEGARMYQLTSGKDWCPNQRHDNERMTRSE